MSKRGLSPVISTILLIVVVVTLAGIVFTWAARFIPEAIDKGGLPAAQACESVVLSASYFSSSGDLQVSNNGNVPLYGVDILIDNNGEIDVDSRRGPILSGSLVEFAGVPSGEEITLIPSIVGDTGEGKKVYKCEDNPVLVEVL